jgi:hypothetical protein
MKSDNMWDLGAEGGQQRLLVPTAGVTAAYAEQAHKVTLNMLPPTFSRGVIIFEDKPRCRAQPCPCAADPDDHA